MDSFFHNQDVDINSELLEVETDIKAVVKILSKRACRSSEKLAKIVKALKETLTHLDEIRGHARMKEMVLEDYDEMFGNPQSTSNLYGPPLSYSTDSMNVEYLMQTLGELMQQMSPAEIEKILKSKIK